MQPLDAVRGLAGPREFVALAGEARRVAEAVAVYPDRGDLLRNYPELEPEDIRQALAFAAANLEDSAA